MDVGNQNRRYCNAARYRRKGARCRFDSLNRSDSMANSSSGEPSLIARLSAVFSKSGDYQARYGKAGGSNSVDYRQHKRLLRAGELPQKHRDLAALVPGESAVDVGAGEGLLALAMAPHKSRVRAIDVTPRRHETARELLALWADKGRDVAHVEMLLGDALSDPSLIDGFDTLVASRVIYYFGDRIDGFMDAARSRVGHVCLVGNPSRNRRYARGKMPADIGQNVRYSTPAGMRELLLRHGFEIVTETDIGDPVVIGRQRKPG